MANETLGMVGTLPERLRMMPSSLNDACRTMEQAAFELTDLRAALARIIKAWDVLKHGDYSRDIVETWLAQEMKPAIDDARGWDYCEESNDANDFAARGEHMPGVTK